MADMTFNWSRLTWPALARRLTRAASPLWRGARVGSWRLESDARVERRRIELLVPEQHLDHPDIGLLLEQVRGKAVPQRVQMDGLVDLGHPRRGVAGPVELTRRERVDRVLPRKQPALRPSHLPPGPQQIEEMLRQHHVSIPRFREGRLLRPLPCSTRMTMRAL